MGAAHTDITGFDPGLFLPGFMSFMLEGLEEGLIACDQRGALLCANRMARDVFGDELAGPGTGADWLKIGDSMNEFPLQRALRGETFRSLEYEYPPAGLRLTFSGGPVLNPAGHLFGAVVLFRKADAKPAADLITDDTISIASDAADAAAVNANDEMDFAMLACHDLRAPLAAVALLANSAVDSEEVDEYFTEAGRIAEESLELVDDIFNIAVLKQKRRIVKARFELREAFDSAVRLCSPLARYKEIEFKTEPMHGSVIGDPARIARVLQNLITNAIKFTASGGTVRLIATRRGSRVRIAVCDDGAGMDREQTRQVMAGSVKGRRSGTAGEKSRGYGLMLVREILERHDAVLKVFSRPGKGSIFFFRLEAGG